MRAKIALGLLLLTSTVAHAQSSLAAELERRAQQVDAKVVAWRRDIHQNPELGNRETRTAKLVADHLRSLGIEVRTGIAHTGVVGILRGGRPGPTVALRADMDALPVTEQADVPFASKVRTQYNGQEVGVMHACGHDNHVAILMGTAEVLAGVKDRLTGTVMFIFQPAEEGAPAGEEGGAALMLEEGVFRDPKPDAVFGLHVMSAMNVGHVGFRPFGLFAASDALRIVVRGKQTHAAMPWQGVDPVMAASHVVVGLQGVVSRQIDVRTAPAVVTVATVNGGVRNNIIPDSVVLTGTIRTLTPEMQKDVHARVKHVAEQIAEAHGATASVEITLGYPVTMNDPALTDWATQTMQRVAGAPNVHVAPPQLGAEDFSYFAREVPGFYIILGGVPLGTEPAAAPSNHSPYFFVDEGVLPLGVRAMTNLAADYLARK